MRKFIISIVLVLLPNAYACAQFNFGGNTNLLRSTGVMKRGNPYQRQVPLKPVYEWKSDQTIRNNDGSMFYGTTLNGRRRAGRLVEPDGTESLGDFDENGFLNGTVEISYVNDKIWFKGYYEHGAPQGKGSLYKDGKYYDVQYDNGEVVASVEVSEPSCKGENWYAKTLGVGVPHHQFFGSGGAGTYKENDSPRFYTVLCPNCYGAGKIGYSICNNCGGLGTLTSYK